MFAEQANGSLAWSWDIIPDPRGEPAPSGFEARSGFEEWTRKRSTLLMATRRIQYLSQEARLSK